MHKPFAPLAHSLTLLALLTVLAVSSVPQLLWREAMKTIEKHAEPMSLMLNRYREIERDFPLTYRKPDPKHDRSVQPEAVHEAASAAASWERSDPFAYARTAHYIRQGYLHSDVVKKEMHLRIVAQGVAKGRQIDV